jgi:hypothetical protein
MAAIIEPVKVCYHTNQHRRIEKRADHTRERTQFDKFSDQSVM